MDGMQMMIKHILSGWTTKLFAIKWATFNLSYSELTQISGFFPATKRGIVPI